jgi:hypothetical protein
VTSSILDLLKTEKHLLQFLLEHQKFRKLGSQEFPEILANTLQYVTKQGGGFGDARLTFVDLTKEI